MSCIYYLMSMLKQVLAFCALMLIPLSVIHSEDDKWIDGIKFRYGEYNYPMSIGKKGANEDDAIWKTTERRLYEPGKRKW